MKLIRQALAHMEPGSSAHKAQDEPALAAIYPVQGHDNALSFDRALVVGNRGMGKSFWAAVLSHEATRKRASALYSRARLDGLRVKLCSHEAAGKQTGDVSPSQREISLLFKQGFSPEQIWQGVLARAISGIAGAPYYDDTASAISAIAADPLDYEKWLRKADDKLSKNGERLLLLFDSLDRLARDWPSIRELSRELLRLSLEINGYKSIRAKIFMRSDQFSDLQIFDFQDASKLKTAAVKLEWSRADLYGLLFSHIWNDATSHSEFRSILSNHLKIKTFGEDMPESLRDDEGIQQTIFSTIAGQFMGTDRRRGRTYSWLHQHLADAFEQTSPRSFLVALNKAATARITSDKTAIDYNGIKEGVVAASSGRVDELKEDNVWIGQALDDLADLEVPCEPTIFTKRWKSQQTVAKIAATVSDSDRPGPLVIEDKTLAQEEGLLRSLIALGVVERRGADRINMPDLFRVAARIKRRGGVKPPVRS